MTKPLETLTRLTLSAALLASLIGSLCIMIGAPLMVVAIVKWVMGC